MGQQQLLLVILVTIIVGVATVVAINIFGQSAENANVDALRQDVLTLSAMSQGWYIKPELMDGGGGDFAGINVYDLGFGYDVATSGTEFSNANGDFVITPGTGDITITATSRINDAITVTAVVAPNEITSLTVAGREGDVLAGG